MTIGERITAFQTLVDRLNTGKWCDEAALPAEMNALAERLARDTTIDLGKTLFVAYQPLPRAPHVGLQELGHLRPGSSR